MEIVTQLVLNVLEIKRIIVKNVKPPRIENTTLPPKLVIVKMVSMNPKTPQITIVSNVRKTVKLVKKQPIIVNHVQKKWF